MHCFPNPKLFQALATVDSPTLIPMYRRLFSDALTPVLAYRRLVQPDTRLAPSFLLESVVGGTRIGRYSYLGSQPVAEIIARGHEVQYTDHRSPDKCRSFHSDDPLLEMDRITRQWQLADVPGLPDFTGGWVGYAGYDTVRYLEAEKLPFGPQDDRGLPDLHMQLYMDVIAFDQVQKTVLLITHVGVEPQASDEQICCCYDAGRQRLGAVAECLLRPTEAEGASVTGLLPDHINLASPPPSLPTSTMGPGGYQSAVRKIKQYIRDGDVFQVVPSQRFEFRTRADPFDIYRALRVVNPSPYMFYLQIEGGMLVASSPEILCHVHNGVVINRPLAGTRRRGRDDQEDHDLESEMLADPKDRAEHIMLVDLGRNDVGRIADPGTIELSELMTVERYSHVMHISSTVTGRLRQGCNSWDVLRATLPVGTVSGAPKVRAMQIIDELEPTKRGPYAGAAGYADFMGNMDMAICLRTMVVMPERDPDDQAANLPTDSQSSHWIVHVQAGGGIVHDSDPDAEHQETLNKAAALAKAIDLAEKAFVRQAH